MKVYVYRCNKCLKLYEESAVKGFEPMHDMFDILDSYKDCKPEKTIFHYCLECFNECVLNPAKLEHGQNIKRDIDEIIREYKYLLKINILRAKK